MNRYVAWVFECVAAGVCFFLALVCFASLSILGLAAGLFFAACGGVYTRDALKRDGAL